MTMIRKLIRAEFTPVGDDEVDVVMSTAALARDGHVLLPQGARLDNYRANPIALWSHDPDHPVGNAENVAISADQITARVRFAPLGISPEADKIRGLVKAGVIRAVSIGFDPLEMEPLDPKKPRGGQRISDWELLELSFVSVPSDTGAVVTARAHGETMTDPKPTTRTVTVRDGKLPFKRGLYSVAQLIYCFEQLGYQTENAKYEAALEGDGSKVPAMLAGVLHDLGDALLAMTQEELAEALAAHDTDPDGVEECDDDTVVVEVERAHIRAATTPASRAFRRGLAHAKLRAGKTLSADTVRCLREAKALHEQAVDMHRSALRKSKDGITAVDGMLDRAGVSDDEDGTAITQTSEGEDADGARALTLASRRRQADLLALTRAA